MKQWFLALLLIVTNLDAAEVVEKDLGFRVAFPDLPGWTAVQRREIGETMSGWFSHFENDRPSDRLTTVITVSFNRRSNDETFLKFAELWHNQQFGPKSDFKARALKVSGHEACEFFDTRTDSSGKPSYMKTVLTRAGDVTYAATFVTSDPAKLDAAIGRDFFDSLQLLELEKAPVWPGSR